MDCPDINRLIDLAQTGDGDEELRTHLQDCPSCRWEFKLIRELPAAFRPEVEVPEELVKRTMAAISNARARPARRRLSSIHGLLAGILGTMTALLAIGISGISGPDAVMKLLVFSIGVGLASGLSATRAALRDPW